MFVEVLAKVCHFFAAEDFLGKWVDSNGNNISVANSGNGWMAIWQS